MPASLKAAATPLALHPSRVIIGVGALLTLGSMSLPYAGGRSSLDVGALPALVLVMFVFAFTLIPDHREPLPRALAVVSAVLAAVALLYSVVTLLDAVVLAGTLGGSIGPGPWLLVAGTVATTAGIALGALRPTAFSGLLTPRRARTGPPPAPTTSSGPSAPNDAPVDDTGHPFPVDESPFEGPLFDSLEIPVFVAGGETDTGDAVSGLEHESPGESDGPEEVTLVFEADRAAGRSAEDAEDGIRGG